MGPSVAFFTVCHNRDYDFLLGSIEHHAEMGFHLVLDTTPDGMAERFKRLPGTVRWVHEPLYGSGWKNFMARTAVERAMNLAKEFDTDVLAYLDSDEFLTKDSMDGLFPHAVDSAVQIHNTHWKKDGCPYMFGESEWHLRLWPTQADMKIVLNTAWPPHPGYDGNRERHPIPVPPPGLPVLRVPGGFHHHLHYILGEKAEDTQTAVTTIDGWPDKGVRVPKVPWPAKAWMWKSLGIRPSEYYR